MLRTAGIVIAFATISLVAFAAQVEKGPAVGEAIPHFMLTTINPELNGGEKVVATKLLVGSAAEKPRPALVLSFAASHCGPCRRELPELARLVGSYRGRGVAAAVVVIDTEEAGIEAMRRFTVDELKLTIPVLSDRFAIVARRYAAETLPLTIVADATGRIAFMRVGYDESTIADLGRVLERLAPLSTPKESR